MLRAAKGSKPDSWGRVEIEAISAQLDMAAQRRAADQSCSLLLAAAGGEPSDAASVRKHVAADHAICGFGGPLISGMPPGTKLRS